MSDFVPFLPALRNRAAAANNAPVAAQPGTDSFTALAPSLQQAAAAPTPAPKKEPRVEVKRSGDRITHIQITCGCGDVIEIACDY